MIRENNSKVDLEKRRLDKRSDFEGNLLEMTSPVSGIACSIGVIT